jgi:hypothetical protein
MKFRDWALIAMSAVLMMAWLLGRIKKDLPNQIRTFNGIRVFLAALPLSLYIVVFFLYELSSLLGEPLKLTARKLIVLNSILGFSSLFLICAVFIGLTLRQALWARIEHGLRSVQLRGDTGAVLRMQISLGQSKAGLLANLTLLALMPIPLFLLRFKRQLFAHFPGQVNWQAGTSFYILTMLMLATALYGLRRNYELWIREKELYKQVAGWSN